MHMSVLKNIFFRTYVLVATPQPPSQPPLPPASPNLCYHSSAQFVGPSSMVPAGQTFLCPVTPPVLLRPAPGQNPVLDCRGLDPNSGRGS